MHLPAHVVMNALVLGRGRWRSAWLVVTAGAVFPDIPMLLFYAYQRAFLGQSESVIWSANYFQSRWQYVFDLSHSIPLIVAAAFIAWRARASIWLVFVLSMFLHALGDLLLHHDDAHAHFVPLSNWRFSSPVSYWDPQHFGRYAAVAELALVIFGVVVLARRSAPWRILGLTTLGIYAGWCVFIWMVWR